MVELQVIGVPAPQGSKSAVMRGGRPIIIEGKSNTGRAKLVEWRRAVADAARAHLTTGAAPFGSGVPVCVAINFRLTRPKSVSKKQRPWPTVKPDIDKLVRSTFDALADGGLISADQQVVQLAADKRYATEGQPPGALISIREIKEID